MATLFSIEFLLFDESFAWLVPLEIIFCLVVNNQFTCENQPLVAANLPCKILAIADAHGGDVIYGEQTMKWSWKVHMNKIALIDNSASLGNNALAISSKTVRSLWKLSTLFISLIPILMSCSKSEKEPNPSPSTQLAVDTSTPIKPKEVKVEKFSETPYEKLSPESDEKVIRYYLSDFSHSRKYTPTDKSIQWEGKGEFKQQEKGVRYTTKIVHTDTIKNSVYHILATSPSLKSNYRFSTVIKKKNSAGIWECHEKIVTVAYANEFHNLYQLNSSTIGYGFERNGLRENDHTTDLLEIYTAQKGLSKKILTVNLRESWESENWAQLTGKLNLRNTFTNGYKEIHYVQKGPGYGPDGEWSETYYDEYCSFNGDIYECSH